MKNSKKIALLSSLAALIGVAGAGTIGANAEVVNPGAPTTFAMEQAAAIRLTSPYGIRFTANISAAEHEALKAYAEANDTTVEYGMLIMPADLVPAGETLDADDAEGTLKEVGTEDNDTDYTNNYYKIVAEPVANTEGTAYAVTAGIKDIKANNVSRPFMARAYALVAGTYYYTDTFERSIYTAATYAIENVDADKTSALTYFKETVIDRVEAAYTTATVEITTESGDLAYDLASVGEIITAKGYVSNGTKTLESKATLSDANLQYVSGTQYKVKDFGTVALTADVGATAEITGKTVNVKEKFGKITQEIADKGLAAKWGNTSYNSITYLEEYEGKKDVLEFETTPTKTSKYVVSSRILTPVAGKYYVFDFNWSTYMNMEWFWYYNGTKNYTSDTVNGAQGNTYDRAGSFYSDADAKNTETAKLLSPVTNEIEEITLFSWRVLDQNGNEINSTIVSHYNEWLTMEIFFPENAGWNFNYGYEASGIAFYALGSNEKQNHFANFRINDYAIQPNVLTGLRPVEELKESYEQNEKVVFETTFIDTIGRTVVGNANAATVAGGAVVENGNVVVLLGQSTVSMDINGTLQSYTLNGPKQWNVPTSALVKGKGYDGNPTNAKITFNYIDEFEGKTDDVLYITHPAGTIYGITLDKKYTGVVPAGVYIYFDTYANKNMAHYTTMMGADAKTPWGSQTAGTINLFNSKGVQIAKSGSNKQAHFNNDYLVDQQAFGQWTRVEYNCTTVALEQSEIFIGGLFGGYQNMLKHFAVSNVIISTERLANVVVDDKGTEDTADDTTTISMEPVPNYVAPTLESYEGKFNLLPSADKLGMYINTFDTDTVTGLVPTTEAIGGVEAGNAYHWAKANSATESSHPYIGFTNAIFNMAKTPAKYWGADKYFSFDIYLTGEVDLGFNLGWNYAHNIALLMGGTENLYAASVKCYDAEGNELTNVDLSLEENQNKWITVEIKCNGSAAPSTVNGLYVQNVLAAGTNVYLKEIYLTNATRFPAQA